MNYKVKSNFSQGKKLLFEMRKVTFCGGLRMAVAGGELTQDTTIARGFHVVEPLAVVTHPTVSARLHAF